MRLYENTSARTFEDAHLLGNGRLGATIYGGVPFEEILINDDTLWSGSESYRVNESYYDNLKRAQALALSGDVKQANNIINDEMEGTWGEAYMPLASAHICVGQKNDRRNMKLKHVISPDAALIKDYSRVLDLDDAVARVLRIIRSPANIRALQRRGRPARSCGEHGFKAQAQRARVGRRSHTTRHCARSCRAQLYPGAAPASIPGRE